MFYNFIFDIIVLAGLPFHRIVNERCWMETHEPHTKPVTRKRRLLNLLLMAGVPIMFYSCVNGMIFYPPACSYQPSTHIVEIPVSTDQHVAAFWLPPRSENDFVVIFSHGNAEDVGHNIDFAQDYHLRGFGVLFYDYRGYGLSPGRPSEHNTYEDIEAAYGYLVNDRKIAPSRIIVHGRSVGSGPSAYLAQKHALAGLILESPFVSAFRVVTHWPIIPFDKYKNLSRIKDIHCPVLIIHSRDDDIVPFWHGEKLFNAANDPKMRLWLEGLGHNDPHDADPDYWKTITEFKNLVIQHAAKEK